MQALGFDNVHFGYGKTPVLIGASFSIEEGELVVLVGDNGSGKSTVAKLADAFLLPAKGSVEVFGKPVAEVAAQGEDAVLALRQEIGYVFQSPDDQLIASTVVDEVAFGPSNLGLGREEVISRTEDALRQAGMLELLGRDVNTLSGGQKQRVAIADALAMRPRLLVMDEPTSMLDVQGRRDVARIAAELRDQGIAILWITHNPDEAAMADRVLAIEDGRVAEVGKAAFLDAFAKSKAALARDAKAMATRTSSARTGGARANATRTDVSQTNAARTDAARTDATPEHDIPLVSFVDASFAYTPENSGRLNVFGQEQGTTEVFDHLSLDVREGELLCLKGVNGSGKSTLLKNMNGLLRPTAGEVLVCGKSTSRKNGANAARRAVGLCFQYPERSFFAQSVYDEVAYGPRSLGIDEAEIDERVRTAMDQMALGFEAYAQANPFDLSGGEQRKVSIASILSMRPRVLAMDEPCASLDAPSHDHLIRLILDLKAQGQTMVLTMHDEDDIDLVADRVFELD